MFRRDKWWHREIEKLRREHAAREAELISTICRLAGNPQPTPPRVRVEQEQHTWTASPEQLPVT